MGITRVASHGDAVLPPSSSAEFQGRNEIKTLTTGAAAATASLLSMTKPPEGPCFVTFETLTTDCYIRLVTSGAAGTTTANGLILKVGTPARFYIDPNVHKQVDAIAPAGAGTLKWYVSSPVLGISAGKAYQT